MKLDKISILVVEDSFIIRDRLVNTLQECPHVKQVFQVGNVEKAIQLLINNPVDVIVLDLGLPDKSGMEVIRFARMQPWNTMIIVLTNQAEAYYKNVCLLMGASHFLDKSVDFEKVPLIIADMYLKLVVDQNVNL